MKRSLLLTILSVVCAGACWLVASLVVANEYVLPTPTDAFLSLFSVLKEGAFYVAFWGTFLRSLDAFVASLFFGVAFALVSFIVPPLRAFFAPFISFIRTVPTMAVILILLLWTSPVVAPILVTVMVLFPSAYALTLSALDSVGRKYSDMARSFCVPTHKKILKMYLPLSAPYILSQAGTLFSMGLKVTVSAEVLSFTYKSLGGMMQEAKIYLEMPKLFALTLLVILVGLAIEGVFYLVSKRVRRWQ